MTLIKELEDIADKYGFDYSTMISSIYLKGINAIFSLLIVGIIFSDKKYSFNVVSIVFSLLCIIILLLTVSFLMMNGEILFLSFRERITYWKFIFSSTKKQNQIKEELKAYIEAKHAPVLPEKYFFEIPALLDDNITLSDWVAKYVRKETSIVNHFVSRFGNPKVKDMYFIRLLIWSQLIPIKKFDLNDLRMVLAANPDLNNEVLKSNNVPLIVQADLLKIFNKYSSQDLTIMLTGDFSIENYLNVVRRSHKMQLELPVMKNIRDLVKYLHLMEEKDFVVKDWQKKITDTNRFEFIEAVTTKDALMLHRAYFKNCIATYSKRLGEGQGMLFVAYKQGHPHIVFYVDSHLKLGDATYRFNVPVSLEDKKILENICFTARS